MQMGNPTDEMNDCTSLFLAEIQETGHNSLKLVVAEGLPVGEPKPITLVMSLFQTAPQSRRPIRAGSSSLCGNATSDTPF